MTFSPKSRSSREERAAKKPRHCHWKPGGPQLGSHSNFIVVVYCLSWALYGVTQPATLIVSQNPRRNLYIPIQWFAYIVYWKKHWLSRCFFRKKQATFVKKIRISKNAYIMLFCRENCAEYQTKLENKILRILSRKSQIALDIMHGT